MKTRSDLIARYDVAGPRYTSYPTVPYWERGPSEAEWLEHLAQALSRGRAAGQGAALYLHVPFCRALCHYCGCNTVITRDTSVSDPYVDRVLAEWKLYRERLGAIRLGELHVGGGTPTFLTAAQLVRLLGGILGQVTVEPGAELGIEADPRVTTAEQLHALAGLGFTRLSLGIQDFDPTVQQAVNRLQSPEEVRAVTESARSAGFTGINYDLIYGLPRQTPEGIRATVETVRTMRPDRIAFYGYAHVPWLKGVQRRFEDADVPAGATKRTLYELGHGLLLEAGYREIGLDHFALETDGLWRAARDGRMHRNFMGYTDRSTLPLFALGVSAIGDTWTAYAQNEKSVTAWAEAVDAGRLPISRGHVLDEEDLRLRRHILDVMTRMETRWDPAQPPLSAEGLATLRAMSDDGLLRLSEGRLEVTEAGRPFVRNACMAFDARLARRAPGAPLFSRTV